MKICNKVIECERSEPVTKRPSCLQRQAHTRFTPCEFTSLYNNNDNNKNLNTPVKIESRLKFNNNLKKKKIFG